jgi:hypothetical protein
VHHQYWCCEGINTTNANAHHWTQSWTISMHVSFSQPTSLLLALSVGSKHSTLLIPLCQVLSQHLSPFFITSLPKIHPNLLISFSVFQMALFQKS